MAVKARAEVTLSSVTDVKAVYRYYLLRSSTLAKPAKPTARPPGGSWDDTEPGYTSGSTNSLYFVDCAVFSDDTFVYSEVSLSSSYEAAKEAYNKANATQLTLEGLTLIDNDQLKIDGSKVYVDAAFANQIFAQDITATGTIKWGANFQLAADGTITAKNGNFSGKITATNGTIGGWTLGGTKIYGGDGETGVAVMQRPDTSNTYVFAAGGTNHANYSDCPFRVTKHGMLYAESGEIGGWTVTGKRIYGGDAKTGVAVMQRPTADTVNVFAAGGTSHDDYTSCPFRVTKYGQLYAGATELTGLLTTRSAGQAIQFPVSNGGNYKITTTDDNWALARYNTSDEWLAYILRFTLSDLNLIVTPSLTVNSSITASGNITTSNTFFCDRGYNENVYFSCYWKDGASHALVNRGTDGLTSSFGWAGNSGYPTITNLRGQTLRAQNASGTTTLSDERLKTDWKDLDGYDAFFDALDPQAFKYVDGSSGRYHLGFGAQSVERALADSGLDNTDFGGLVKFPVPLASEDWRGYDEEYGLIYSEFVALLVDQVQKLKREVRDLKNQMGGNANV